MKTFTFGLAVGVLLLAAFLISLVMNPRADALRSDIGTVAHQLRTSTSLLALCVGLMLIFLCTLCRGRFQEPSKRTGWQGEAYVFMRRLVWLVLLWGALPVVVVCSMYNNLYTADGSVSLSPQRFSVLWNGWLLLGGLAASLFAVWSCVRSARFRRLNHEAGYGISLCGNCGYNLTGTHSGRCPECGASLTTS